MSRFLIGLGLLFFVSSLPARQGSDRQRASEKASYRRITIGRTVLPGGKAWAGAEVFFLHRPIPRRPDIGTEDLIQVQASAKGRFRVQLLERRAYMVWAHKTDEKGRAWVSQVHGLVMAGQPLKLQRGKSAWMPERVSLVGWKKADSDLPMLDPRYAPMQEAVAFRLRFGPMQQALPVAEGKQKGTLVLPVTPYDDARLEALDSQGRVLHELSVERRRFPLFPVVWGCPYAKKIFVTIKSGNKKDDVVSGAEIRVRGSFEAEGLTPLEDPDHPLEALMPRTPHSLWNVVGISDAEGLCKIQIPVSAVRRGSMFLQIRAAGMQEKFVQPSLSKTADIKNLGSTSRLPVSMHDIQLTKRPGITGRILWKEGTPAGNFPFLVQRRAQYRVEKREHTILPPAELHHTLADGSFSFVAPEGAYRIITALDEDIWRRLAGAYEDLPLPDPEVLLHEAPKGGKSKAALGDIRLDRLVAVDARFAESRERDATPGIVLFKDQRDLATGSSLAPSVLGRRFGPRGRAIFLMPPGKYDSLALHPKRGSSEAPLILSQVMVGTVYRWNIPLQPYAAILVKVRTQDGKPVPSMPLNTNGGGYTHLSRFCAEIYQFNTKAIDEAVTDAKGDAILHLLNVREQSYDVMVNWRAAERMGASVSPVRVSSNGYPESIEIELRR